MPKSTILESRGCPYRAYYHDQVGSGVSRVYSGASHQKGHGIGSLLGSLWRWATPLLTRGAKAVGKQALKAGGNIIADVSAGAPIKQTLKRRFRDVVDHFGQGGQEGSGRIKRRRRTRKKVIRRRTTKRTARQKTPVDYFT